MVRKKNNSPQAVRNRNNRTRGANFEKKVADILDMFVVPYSGSNARFGWGDIRDIEGREGGVWLGECKNISDDNGHLTIQRKWITDIIKKSQDYHLRWFLAFMRSGKPEKFILMDEYTCADVICGCNTTVEIAELHKKVHNVVNLIIPYDLLLGGTVTPMLDQVPILAIKNEGDDKYYYIMRIEVFKHHIMAQGLHSKLGR